MKTATDNTQQQLAGAAFSIAQQGLQKYFEAHRELRPVSLDACLECLRSWTKIRLPQAMAEFKAAHEIGMTQVGVATFAATMGLAGIEAAKECSEPK